MRVNNDDDGDNSPKIYYKFCNIFITATSNVLYLGVAMLQNKFQHKLVQKSYKGVQIMEEDQKFKLMMTGTVILFVVILVYVGAGSTGFLTLGTEDTNALSISDYNVLLNECREETDNLLQNNISQSNTIDNVNDLLNQSRNQTDQLGIDLNNCQDDINTEIQKWQDLNSQIYDINANSQLCKNNLVNAINQKITCEEEANDLNTFLHNAEQDILDIEDDLDQCEARVIMKDGDIETLALQINTKDDIIDGLNSDITTLNSDVNILTTTNNELTLDLNTTATYLCGIDGNYCCDLNGASWAWC